MKRKIGLAIGSGGVYSAAAIGVLESLEKEGFIIQHVGGASGGAIIAALYFLEGNAKSTKQKFLQKLPAINSLKLSPFGKRVLGNKARDVITEVLDNRNWDSGKLKSVCFGAAYTDSKEPIILTKESGLSLVDCVVASTSLKMIEPTIKLNGRLVAHGGDPKYIEGIKTNGANFIIEVSPNVDKGFIGKLAKVANKVSSALILKGDYFTRLKSLNVKVKADFSINPNLNLYPFISPLNFSNRNANYIIEKGRQLTEQALPELLEAFNKKY